jgi:hypothetical protein
MRIQSFDRRFRAFDLGAANICCAVQNLALEIRQRDYVVVENANLADARRREILNERRSETARAYDEDPRGLQLLLARSTDAAQHDMARIALDFFALQKCCDLGPILIQRIGTGFEAKSRMGGYFGARMRLNS